MAALLRISLGQASQPRVCILSMFDDDLIFNQDPYYAVFMLIHLPLPRLDTPTHSLCALLSHPKPKSYEALLNPIFSKLGSFWGPFHKGAVLYWKPKEDPQLRELPTYSSIQGDVFPCVAAAGPSLTARGSCPRRHFPRWELPRLTTQGFAGEAL